MRQRASLVGAALVLLASGGCGQGAAGDIASPKTSPKATTETASPTSESTRSAEPTPGPTPSETATSGAGDTITVTDDQRYQWQVMWSFDPPAPQMDVSMDPPGQASAVWDTTSAQVDVVFATPNRTAHPYDEDLDALELGVLYPADGPVCEHLVQGDVMTGGRKGNATLTSPSSGAYCYSPINSGYANYPGLGILGLPESEVPAVLEALGEPDHVVLVDGGEGVTSSAADDCTIVMEDSYQTALTVLSSSPGPITC